MSTDAKILIQLELVQQQKTLIQNQESIMTEVDKKWNEMLATIAKSEMLEPVKPVHLFNQTNNVFCLK